MTFINRVASGQNTRHQFDLFEQKYMVSAEQLKKLRPYVINLIEQSKNPILLAYNWAEKLKIRIFNDTQAAFEIDNDSIDLLKAIRELCRKNLTEDIIVSTGTICHRVMDFSIKDNLLVVTYVTMDGNASVSFDDAILWLGYLYPSVSRV
jgi:hypothetical protein